MNKLEYQRNYVKLHREELKEKRKIYERNKYKTDPLWSEKKKKRHKDWYDKNKETFLSKAKEKYKDKKDLISIKRKERLLNETVEQREKRLSFHREYNKRNRIISSKKNQTDIYKYNQYNTSAKTRGYPFELTYEEFIDIFHSPCNYCGKQKARGIDRIENDKGYIKDNSTPCCAICNKMKWKYSKIEFKEHIKKIYKHIN